MDTTSSAATRIRWTNRLGCTTGPASPASSRPSSITARTSRGTAQVKVMALRALGLNGQGSSFNTSQAIRWAAQNGAKLINLSLGTNETFGGPTDIQLAIDYAWSRGALVVAAAGTAGTGTLD